MKKEDWSSCACKHGHVRIVPDETKTQTRAAVPDMDRKKRISPLSPSLREKKEQEGERERNADRRGRVN